MHSIIKQNLWVRFENPTSSKTLLVIIILVSSLITLHVCFYFLCVKIRRNPTFTSLVLANKKKKIKYKQKLQGRKKLERMSNAEKKEALRRMLENDEETDKDPSSADLRKKRGRKKKVKMETETAQECSSFFVAVAVNKSKVVEKVVKKKENRGRKRKTTISDENNAAKEKKKKKKENRGRKRKIMFSSEAVKEEENGGFVKKEKKEPNGKRKMPVSDNNNNNNKGGYALRSAEKMKLDCMHKVTSHYMISLIFVVIAICMFLLMHVLWFVVIAITKLVCIHVIN